MQIVLDSDIKAVAEFMQGNIPAAKLVSVADNLPTVARLLWSQFPQESCDAAAFDLPKTGQENRLLPDANELVLDEPNADGDFGEAKASR